MNLNKKFKEWEKCLVGNGTDGKIDINSIEGIVIASIREMAIFESYMAICEHNPKSLLASALFSQSFIYNYLDTQSIRIRKLTDYNLMDKDDTKQVYSLARILGEMKECRKSGTLTRDAFCDFYGIQKNASVAKSDLEESYDQIFEGESFNANAHNAVRIHQQLDHIYDKHGTMKKPFINSLEERLLGVKNENLKKVHNIVNKYIAHAATVESRQSVNTEYKYDRELIKTVLKDITESFLLFEHLIRGAGWVTLVAVGWETYFTNLSKNDANIASKVFRKLEEETKSWENYAIEKLGLN